MKKKNKIAKERIFQDRPTTLNIIKPGGKKIELSDDSAKNKMDENDTRAIIP